MWQTHKPMISIPQPWLIRKFTRYQIKKCGGVLLSRPVSRTVPSALEGLTCVFGMGTGVSPPLSPPQNLQNQIIQFSNPNQPSPPPVPKGSKGKRHFPLVSMDADGGDRFAVRTARGDLPYGPHGCGERVFPLRYRHRKTFKTKLFSYIQLLFNIFAWLGNLQHSEQSHRPRTEMLPPHPHQAYFQKQLHKGLRRTPKT